MARTRQHIFTAGDLVRLKTRVGRKEVWVLATFRAMQTRSRVIVSVEEGKLDGETVRLVDLRSLRPYYDHPTHRQQRAKSAVRKYKMGVRVFRLGKPDGAQFHVTAIDVDSGVACGTLFKRKTVKQVPLHELFPDHR